MCYAAIDSTSWLCDDGPVRRVPDSVDIGDRITILLAGTVPILLRLSASDCVIQDEAYVDDMMDGQAFRGPEVQIKMYDIGLTSRMQTMKSTSPLADTLWPLNLSNICIHIRIRVHIHIHIPSL